MPYVANGILTSTFVNSSTSITDIQQNAAGNWEYSAIDWKEFNQVLAGNGPCNRDRLTARRKAHDDGAWVREAALAYAGKQATRAHRQAA